MHAITTSLLLISLLLPSALSQYCRGDPSSEAYCTDLTFINTTTGTSPTVDLCNDRCAGISWDAGDWIADFRGRDDNYKDTMIIGNCQFGMTRGNKDTGLFYMHNQDLFNVYWGAITRYGSGGRVSAKGTMVCQGQAVKWFLG